MAFYVGQKVVCIRQCAERKEMAQVELGAVYTIRNIKTRDEGTGFRLHEITNPCVATTIGFIERYYRAEQFRPAVERKTSIEIFERILRGNRIVEFT